MCKVAFEVSNGCESTLENPLVHEGEVFITFGKLVSADGDEFMSFKAVRDFGYHECHLRDVEQKEGLDTMSHVVWRVASQLVSSDKICPEDMVSKRRPLCNITIAGLYEGVMDGAMRTFDNSICLQVVC